MKKFALHNNSRNLRQDDISLFEKLRKPLPSLNPVADKINNQENLQSKDTSIKEDESKSKTDHQKPKKIHSFRILFASITLIFIFLIILLLSYTLNLKNKAIKSKENNQIVSNLIIQDNITIENTNKLFDKAIILENKNDILKGLKKRLTGINQYIQLQEYQVALEEAKTVSKIIHNKFSDSNNVDFQLLKKFHHNFLSKIYYHLNKIELAVQNSHKALEISLQYQQNQPLKIIEQYHMLAFNLDNIGQFEEALTMRHNAIKLMLKNPKNILDEGMLITEMNNLAEEYRKLGYLSEAKNLLMTSINRIENKFGIDAPEMIIVLNNLGLTQYENKRKPSLWLIFNKPYYWHNIIMEKTIN